MLACLWFKSDCGAIKTSMVVKVNLELSCKQNNNKARSMILISSSFPSFSSLLSLRQRCLLLVSLHYKFAKEKREERSRSRCCWSDSGEMFWIQGESFGFQQQPTKTSCKTLKVVLFLTTLTLFIQTKGQTKVVNDSDYVALLYIDRNAFVVSTFLLLLLLISTGTTQQWTDTR